MRRQELAPTFRGRVAGLLQKRGAPDVLRKHEASLLKIFPFQNKLDFVSLALPVIEVDTCYTS